MLGGAPFREPVLQTSSVAPPSAQESDGVVGEHAVRASAVGDDFDIGRQPTDAFGRVDRSGRAGATNVSRRIFGFGANVDDDQGAVVEASGELVSADLFEAAAVPEIVRCEVVEVVEVCSGDRAQRRSTAARHRRTPVGSRCGFRLGVLRQVPLRRAPAGGVRCWRRSGRSRSRVLRRAFTLGQDVDEFDAAPVPECFGDVGEAVEQSVLCLAVSPYTNLLKRFS